ncbi:lantibiotic dehydratase [Sphingobacterium mizutaii]|uniref:lantibiotic dehydratase n=1 Tax=Sphingobacterium mizutaii TaxID=1010 RepID=UPI001627C9A9|nr:lantibiotic dehydratase [Sphingobacterium mizutaii]
MDFLTEINRYNTEETFWKHAVEILSDQQILDAIAIASQDFHKQISDILDEPYCEKVSMVLPSLYKYLSRMSHRPTPFGKFSSISVGNISNNPTDIILSNRLISKYRLDHSFQEMFRRQLMADEEALKEIIFYPNSTLTESLEYYSFIEFIEKNDDRIFNWSRIRSNPLLKFLLQDIHEGKKYKEIFDILISIGIPENKIKAYIGELIDLKILIPELEPITTDDTDYWLERAIDLAKKPNVCTDTLMATLNQVQKALPNIYCDPDECDNVQIDKPKSMFHVDTVHETLREDLNKGDVLLITKEIFELINLNSNRMPEDLQVFTRKFISRYGDREIPLMEALDPEYGIGYGKQSKSIDKDYPLLSGINDIEDNKAPSANKRFLDYFLDKHLDHVDFDQKVLELDSKDFNILESIQNLGKFVLPHGFYIVGNLLKTKNSTDNKQSLRFHLTACGGTSSLPLLTRFTYLDKTLYKRLKECAKEEEASADQAILAEVVFFPKGKAGNVLRRSSLFAYEIPIICQSAVDDEHTMLLSDLFVRIVNGRIMLRSQKLNKTILPRLSSAHNFHYGMAIYRFLCDLQFQDNPLNISWDWGIASKRTFLPRITYKHLILSRAQWNIRTNTLRSKAFKDDRERIEYLRSRFHLPQKVVLIQGDNELAIDLNHEVAARILLKELQRNDIRLTENIYDDFISPVRNIEGKSFTNEIIIPIHGESSSNATVAHFDLKKDISRTFVPGSEWLYLKIYCGEKQSDKIIRDELKKIIQKLKHTNQIQKWFFIRYHDPEPHIRIRFHLRGDLIKTYSKTTKIINESFCPLIEQGKISRVSYDTYERELERYGPSNIENCEMIFNLESEVIISVLELVKGKGEHLRWSFAMILVDRLFSAFGLKDQEKIDLIELLRNNFLEEFTSVPKLKYKMDQNFRAKKDEISAFFMHTVLEDLQVNSIIRQYEHYITDYANMCIVNKDYQLRPKGIVSALSHMLLNRIFNSRQREQEMVIYHFLSKYLLSLLKK